MTNQQNEVVSFKQIGIAASGVLLVSLALLLCWANLAPMESASIAPGFIRAEGNNQKIEHLHGGKVESIAVKNGSSVKAGDVLVRVDTSELKIKLSAVLNEYLVNLAQRDIARAQVENRDTPVFDNETLTLAQRLDKQQVVNTQKADYQARKDMLSKKTQNLEMQSQQLKVAISSERLRLASIEKQSEILSEQLESYEKLVKQQHIARLQVVDLQQRKVELSADIATIRKSIEEKGLKLEELVLRRQQLRIESRREATAMLVRSNENIPALQSSIKGLQQRIENSVIKAHISGRVTDLAIDSTGETIAPDEEIMKIIPSRDRLVIEARLNTIDIEDVEVGQAARIRLSAYNRRKTPMLDATVTRISPDRMRDELGYYYQLELGVDTSVLNEHPGVIIAPGMPVESIIVSEARSLMDYLLEPVTRGIQRSMRES